MKIKIKQEEKIKNELIGCTFHPIILTNNSATGYYQNQVYLENNYSQNIEQLENFHSQGKTSLNSSYQRNVIEQY